MLQQMDMTKIFYLNIVASVVAGLITTVMCFVICGGSGLSQSLAAQFILLSPFFWTFFAVLSCATLLSVSRTNKWFDFLITPAICAVFSFGIIQVAIWTIGRRPFFELAINADLLTFHVFAKLRDALLGWGFAVPLWLYLIGRNSRLAPAVLCFLFSVLHLFDLFLLP
jgi:hypothetical protein